MEKQEAEGVQLNVGELGFLRIALAPYREEAPHTHTECTPQTWIYETVGGRQRRSDEHEGSCMFFFLFCQCVSLWDTRIVEKVFLISIIVHLCRNKNNKMIEKQTYKLLCLQPR